MNTEQEQIKEMTETLLAHEPIIDVPYETINDIVVALVKAGYGNISEYEAEREMLGSQIKVLKQRLNNKYVEIEQLKDDYAKLQEQFADYQMASDKEIAAQVKQAKIDVLNELKTHSYYDDDYMDSYVFVSDIDELIEEVENETKKETSRSTL